MPSATKLTLAQLKTAATAYVLGNKQAQTTITATIETMSKLLNKIGKEIIIPQEVNDKLSFLDADPMTLGRIIEETFIDFITDTAYNSNAGADNVATAYPVFEDAAYSFELGRRQFKITQSFGNIEAACKDAGFFGEIMGTIVQRLTQSEALYKYSQKKQLLANLITKAEAISGTPLSEVLAAPTTTQTGEAFVKSLKNAVEASQFANTSNLAQTMAGAAPVNDLVLFIKKGYMGSLDVDTMAGAFHTDKLAVPARIVVVDDFGDAADKYYAVLADTRGIKMHQTYNATRTAELADSDAINYVKHVDYTAFLSKYTYVRVYKTEA